MENMYKSMGIDIDIAPQEIKKSKQMGIYIDGDIYRFAPQDGNFRKKRGYNYIYIYINRDSDGHKLTSLERLQD